jgi:hypothetical protein
MDRPSVETAIDAANVALTGRRSTTVTGFASIALKDGVSESGRWEILVGAIVGVSAFVAVVVAWLY